ncbi:MAG: cation diffusion facilitator family transporter [Bacteroidota bacterium]
MNTERKKSAQKVTWLGFFANVILMIFKLLAGIFGRSSAMVADAIHSLSDFATDLVVVGSLSVASKPQDHNHKYGHGKVETLAAAFIGIVLFGVAVGLCYTSIVKIYEHTEGDLIPRPGLLALYAAGFSIVVKEILYQYSIKIGREINSSAVIANAWHHRSDVLSSFGTLIGIGGAIFLGEKWVVLDPIAAIVVSVFIFRVAYKISKEALLELIETSLPEKSEKDIIELASEVNGVNNPHNLKTRKIGNVIAIDLHIQVDSDLNIKDAHKITVNLEKILRREYGDETIISIHTEPLE